MKNSTVRVRFAPSPSGHLHVGGARTALFNWLFARKNDGVFVLRIEDTDAERSTSESIAGILDSLRWLGLDWDEGPGVGGMDEPYQQSLRNVLYRAEAERLLRDNKAYRCYCTKEELDTMRSGDVYEYDRRCARLTDDEKNKRLVSKAPHVVRFSMKQEGVIAWVDLTCGALEFRADLIDDFVVMKSDGNPTYNFAAVVDDAKMQITHVIRGDDHISNTPKQLALYEALGFNRPEFAHLPMIVGKDKQRLSKRYGANSVTQFRGDGTLPQAMLNYLALLGWSPGNDQEILTVQDLVSAFDLKRVSRNPAMFDEDKLHWMNGEHFSTLSLGEKVRRLLPQMKRQGLWPPEFRVDLSSGPHLRVVTGGDDAKIAGSITPISDEQWLREEPSLAEELPRLKLILQALGSRLTGPRDVREQMDYFYVDSLAFDSKSVEKHLATRDHARFLGHLADVLQALPSYSTATIETGLRELAEHLGVKAGYLIHPARVALTGRAASPGVFDVLYLVGRTVAVDRLRRGVDIIERNLQLAEGPKPDNPGS